MINFLDYFKTYVENINNKNIKKFILNELEDYKKYWNMYKDDISFSPLYDFYSDKYDSHKFNLKTGFEFSIFWDIEKIYNYAIKHLEVLYITNEDFELSLATDLKESKEELINIYNEINSIHDHKFVPLLIMFFQPMNCYLLLDGRHRYIEYKKFTPSSNIPVYVVDDEACMNCIVLKNQLLFYAILHNLNIFNKIIAGEDSTQFQLLKLHEFFDVL